METNGRELYHKYRPKSLKELVGQKEAVEILGPRIVNGTVPHALLLAGPSGCLRGDTLIYDPMDGSNLSVHQRWTLRLPFHVLSLDASGRTVIAEALPPVRYPQVPMFCVKTPLSTFFVTGEHQFLSEDGTYLSLKVCDERRRESVDIRLLSTWASDRTAQQQDDRYSSRTTQGSQADCHRGHHFYGELPLEVPNTYQSIFPLQAGVLGRTLHSLHEGDLGRGLGYNHVHSPSPSLPYKTRFSPHNLLWSGSEYPFCEGRLEYLLDSFQLTSRPPIVTILLCKEQKQEGLSAESKSWTSLVLSGDDLLPFDPPVVGEVVTGWTKINNIVECGQDHYYDFHVPIHNNYWCGGLFHHNCGKTSIAMILKDKLKCGLRDFTSINCAIVDNPIETIRGIDSQMQYHPIGGVCRIFFLDEVQALTRSHFGMQSMLGMLEFTPSHCYFILATTDPNKILRTIRTRCTEINVRLLTEIEVKGLVETVAKKEGVRITEAVVSSIIEHSQGSARKALVLLDQVSQLKDEQSQLNTIESTDHQKQAIDLCRALLKPGIAWSEIVPILRDLQDEPEAARRAVLGYATGVLLKPNTNGRPNKIAARASVIIDAFESDYFQSGKSGLVNSAYKVVAGD